MNKLSQFLGALVLLFFISPFLILLFNLKNINSFGIEEFIWALKNSFLQSIYSVFISSIIGFLLIDGIFYFKRKCQNKFALTLIEFLILLPSFLPALFTLLIFLSVLQPFPFGLIGVSLIHGMTYAGLFAVTFAFVLEKKAKGFFEVSYLLGVAKYRMYFESIKMLKWDLFFLTALIFTICFTSFSVPVAVGGGRGTTLEILIYEKMRLSGNWSEALILSLIQSLFVGILMLFFSRRQSTQQPARATQIKFLGGAFSATVTALYLFFFAGGFFFYSLEGWEQVFSIPGLWKDALSTIPATITLGVGAGIMILIFFLISTLSLYEKTLHRFLLSYLAPSVSLIGLSVILLSPASQEKEILFYILATVLFFFCGLYKMGFEQALMALKKQVEVANLLGANFFQITFKIVIPQILPVALNLSGVGALWVIGDFALCKVIFTRDFLLAQLIEDLMASYRIEAATALMSLLILFGFVVYFLFAGVGYVFNYQSDKKIR